MRKLKVKQKTGTVLFIQDDYGSYLQFIPSSISDIDLIKGEDLLQVLPQEISSIFSLESHPNAAGVTIKFEPKLLIDKLLQSSLFSDVKEEVIKKLGIRF